MRRFGLRGGSGLRATTRQEARPSTCRCVTHPHAENTTQHERPQTRSCRAASTRTTTLQSPKWDLPFEIMCDASDYAVGALLGQRLIKKPMTICYASKTLIEAQINYTTAEKELLAVVYALEKF